MIKVTAAEVNKLRQATGAGMMDCKKALVETNGDVEVAIENMRKSGQAKAAKKAGRIAAEGVIIAKVAADKAILVEINCETDFVARDESFLAFANAVAELALAHQVTTIEALNLLELNGLTVEETRANLVAKIGENMSIRRVSLSTGNNMGTYVHGSRIGVAVELQGGDEALAKDLAMHVAASNPQFVKPENVPADVVEKEKSIQLEIAMQSGKPAEIAEKMVSGRMSKFTGEISLTGQPFVKDPAIKVGQLLKEANADVIGFTRFEVGEGIEKKEDDFASEVAAQIAATKQG